MTTYKIIDDDTIQKDNNVYIPVDQGNVDYREYLDWIKAGNAPSPADPRAYDVSILTDSPTIIGDGADEITLTVHGEPDALVEISTLTGVTAGTLNVQLDKQGIGSQAFACDTSPTVIVFSHGDVSCKVRAL
jgi:hypothetical protein